MDKHQLYRHKGANRGCGKNTAQELEDKTPADIVAAKDCVINEIIVVSGIPAVKKGDTVRKGDLLIKGAVAVRENPEEPSTIIPGKPIRANGIIRGRVWYEGYGEAEMGKTDYQRTGAETVGIVCAVGEKKFTLKSVTDMPYSCYEYEEINKKIPLWRNTGFSVEAIIMKYRELKYNKYQITSEEAREIARTRAIGVLQDITPENACILSRNFELLPSPEADLVRVKLSVETIEDIGIITKLIVLENISQEDIPIESRCNYGKAVDFFQ